MWRRADLAAALKQQGGFAELVAADVVLTAIDVVECAPPPENLNFDAFGYYRRLSRVKNFVDLHYSEPLPLRIVACVAGLETSYFSKFFREKVGIRYLEWLSWIRVQHAVALMRTRNVPITELAFAVGFQDVRSFQRAFNKHTGSSPSTIKRHLRPDTSA
jgi:transcriptional regulator GlxA family with amidase domain